MRLTPRPPRAECALTQSGQKNHALWFITPLPAQISASNFHDLTQITQRRVCFNPKRTEKPKAHGFSVRFGLKHTLREVVVVLIANITLQRGVIWDLAFKAHGKFSKAHGKFPCALKAKSQITPLRRVMFAINTSRRVCFNPKRTEKPCTWVKAHSARGD